MSTCLLGPQVVLLPPTGHMFSDWDPPARCTRSSTYCIYAIYGPRAAEHGPQRSKWSPRASKMSSKWSPKSAKIYYFQVAVRKRCICDPPTPVQSKHCFLHAFTTHFLQICCPGGPLKKSTEGIQNNTHFQTQVLLK